MCMSSQQLAFRTKISTVKSFQRHSNKSVQKLFVSEVFLSFFPDQQNFLVRRRFFQFEAVFGVVKLFSKKDKNFLITFFFRRHKWIKVAPPGEVLPKKMRKVIAEKEFAAIKLTIKKFVQNFIYFSSFLVQPQEPFTST